MVFYSLLYRTSQDLPYLLNHNVTGTLFIPGDFVLALFLFAAGASIPFFVENRLESGWNALLTSSLKKIAKLAIVWLSLSVLTLNLSFGMDEIALAMVLFVPCIFLSLASPAVSAALFMGMVAVHYALQSQGMLPDFTEVYLGGFTGALWHLPVALAGLVVVRADEHRYRVLLGSCIVTILLLPFQAADKLALTAAFSALSSTFCLSLFLLCQNFEWAPLTYLGRKPLRYWVMMYLFFIIPIKWYCLRSEVGSTRLSLEWGESLAFSAAALVVLYIASKAFDRFTAWKP